MAVVVTGTSSGLGARFARLLFEAGAARELDESLTFLLGDAAAYLTGQMLTIDGGIVAR